MTTAPSRNAISTWVTILLCLVLATGCQTSDTTLRDSGRSEAYITGFHDGRHSGMKEAGNYLEHVVKDVQRFEQDADYKAGWLAGEQEGIRMQQQANAAVGSAEGYRIAKEADKSVEKDIEKAARSAIKDVDTDSLKTLK